MVTRWNDISKVFAALEEFRRYVNSADDDTDYSRWTQRAHSLSSRGWPTLNVYDEGSELLLDAEVPGLSEQDIQLSLNQNVLSISGERKVEAPKDYAVHRQERQAIKFARSISLPCQVNTEKVTARVRDGMLTVIMEKTREAQPRQITIKAS